MNCPICKKEIKKQLLGYTRCIISCENFCFENFKEEFPSCPVCENGQMSITFYNGKEFKKCNNKECNFEISTNKLITLIIKGICK